MKTVKLVDENNIVIGDINLYDESAKTLLKSITDNNKILLSWTVAVNNGKTNFARFQIKVQK